MYAAALVIAVMGGFVAFAGFRVRALVPRHWPRVTGRWIGPNLRWSPALYEFVTVDGVGQSGVAKVKVMFRPAYGGACIVAYDPSDPSRSQPAQLRWNGGILVAVGLITIAAGIVFTLLSAL